MKTLVDILTKQGYLSSEKIQDAFLRINRRDFLPDEFEAEAERDVSFPIGFGKQIIQPQKAAFILENLDINSGQKILCVGSDSGWLPNILAKIVEENGKVFVIDEVSSLTKTSQDNSRHYDFLKDGKIQFITSNEIEGFSAEAPYDRIVSLVSFLTIPEKLKKQLKVGGKMLIPINKHYISIERKSSNQFLEDDEIQSNHLINRVAGGMYSQKK